MRKEGIVWKTFKVLVILLGMVLILGPIFVIFINFNISTFLDL